MPRYTLDVSERYDDDDEPETLHRMGGAPVGLRTEDWPRHHGRPMQHAFTIDLADVSIDVPRAETSRAVAVFLDSYYELDVDSSEGIAVVWLTQEQIDACPKTEAPDDHVPEKLPGHEVMDEEGDYYEAGEPIIELGEPDDDEGSFGDSYIGGAPQWSDAGEPEQLPGGAFVLQVMSYEFPVCRRNASLFVFEEGAYIQPEDPEEEDVPPSWPQALADARQVVIGDEAPAPDALQKWGGLPRGVSSYDWPKRMSHILTWIPDSIPEDVDAVAFALFGRLSKADDWDTGELTFYQVQEIRAEDLEEWSPDEIEVPKGAEVLEQKVLELRSLPDGIHWRDLQTMCVVGTRFAWRRPDHRSAEDPMPGPVMQLTDEVLPVTPGPGTLHIPAGGYPIWHPAPGAPQAGPAERYQPQGSLYDSSTTAAIVVGWQVRLEESVLPERLEALEQTLLAALSARGLSELTLFVPGDTTTDRHAEVYGSVVVGRSVVIVEADDEEPGPVRADGIEARMAELPALDAAFWREALAFCEGAEPPGAPGAYMLSWGPLCYAGLHVGVAATRSDEAAYTFIANQNMRQEWSSQGIDGEFVEGVEFSEVCEVVLSDEALAKVDRLSSPGFWLICRYD